MRKIEVKTSSPYQVLLQRGLLNQSAKLINKVKSVCEVVIVSDSNVYPLYGELVKQSLEKLGYNVGTFVFPQGEQSKNFDTILQALDYFADFGLTRGGLVIALGGGIVGDLAGFAASIYLRGVKFVQIPTTLLAAIDSSVGGKTGVNLAQGKNLVGAFYQPILVICDPDVFNTLPEKIFTDGICEAIKYGVIKSKSLFAKLSSTPLVIEDIVEECVIIKRDIVEKDELDHGERMLLNFGHTPAHAIETISEYNISHGHAVGIGMYIMAKASEKLNLCEQGCSDKINDLLHKYNVDLLLNYDPAELAKIALSDKKVNSGILTVILPTTIGQACLKPIQSTQIENIFNLGLKE